MMRSEIFFKFTGYSYKLASGWKLTLSTNMPLLPFKGRYECIMLPKTHPKIPKKGTYQLWMITKNGDYRRIRINPEVMLDLATTQLNIMYNAIERQILLSVLTKQFFTNI